MCASRLDCHVVYLGVMVPFASRCVYPTAPQFSAGIVFLCEDLRDSHIIRERPGSWHRRKGLEPSSGGFGDRCSSIKLRLHVSPMPGLEPGSVRTQLKVHRPGGLCLPPCECRYRLTGISELMRTRSPPKRVRTAVCPVTCRASCPYHTCPWVVPSFSFLICPKDAALSPVLLALIHPHQSFLDVRQGTGIFPGGKLARLEALQPVPDDLQQVRIEYT